MTRIGQSLATPASSPVTAAFRAATRRWSRCRAPARVGRGEIHDRRRPRSAQDQQDLRSRHGAARRELRGPCRRGGRTDRRQRRRQEHAGQDPLRTETPSSAARSLIDGKPVAITGPDGRPPARHRDRLPGPRTGAAPQPGAEHVPRAARSCAPGCWAGSGFMDNADDAARAARSRLRRPRRHGAQLSPAASARCPAARSRPSRSRVRPRGRTKSSSSTSPPRRSASCRPRAFSSSSSASAIAVWASCSSATPCRTSWRSPTRSRSCASARASPSTAPQDTTMEQLVGAMTGAVTQEEPVMTEPTTTQEAPAAAHRAGRGSGERAARPPGPAAGTADHHRAARRSS